MAQSTPDELAAKLQKWALDEMHFRPQGRHVNAKIPSVDAFRSVCRGQMVDVWQFVLDRVRSDQTVKKVKGNLKLHNRHTAGGCKVTHKGAHSEERAELLDQKRELTAQLASGVSAGSHVERDIERQRSNILNIETQYTDSKDVVLNTRRKCALLDSFSQEVQEEVDKYKEYTTRIKDKSEALAVRSGEDTQYFSRQVKKPGDKPGLETASEKAVRESLFEIGEFLQQIVKGSYSYDRDLMYKDKEKLWTKIEDILTKFPPNDVVASLGVNIHDTVLDLRDKTAKVNITRDAENLQFKFEDGQLKDISTPPSTRETIHRLHTERHWSHFQEFVRKEEHLNHTFRLRDRISSVMKCMDDILRSSFHGNPGALELARKLFDTEVHTAADRAAVLALDEQAEELRNEISRATREKDALYAKYRKIKVFKELAGSKQDLIRVLVKQKSAAKGRFDRRKEKIEEYIQASLADHEGETLSLTEQLKDSIVTEVDDFAKLLLPFLMYTVLDSGLRLAVLDLSIHRLQLVSHSSAPTGGSVNQGSLLQRVLDAIEFPVYKAPECLLPQVVKLQQKVCDLEMTLASHEAFVHNIKAETDELMSTVENIAGQYEQMKDHNKAEMDELFDMLQQRLSQLTQAFSDCLRLKDEAHDWWEQPAATLVPWITVDGHNLRQWRDKWHVAVTRLRQLQMASPTTSAPQ